MISKYVVVVIRNNEDRGNIGRGKRDHDEAINPGMIPRRTTAENRSSTPWMASCVLRSAQTSHTRYSPSHRELFLLHGFTGVRPPFDARRRASSMSVSSSASPEISSTESSEMASRSCSGARATAPVSPVS